MAMSCSDCSEFKAELSNQKAFISEWFETFQRQLIFMVSKFTEVDSKTEEFRREILERFGELRSDLLNDGKLEQTNGTELDFQANDTNNFHSMETDQRSHKPLDQARISVADRNTADNSSDYANCSTLTSNGFIQSSRVGDLTATLKNEDEIMSRRKEIIQTGVYSVAPSLNNSPMTEDFGDVKLELSDEKEPDEQRSMFSLSKPTATAGIEIFPSVSSSNTSTLSFLDPSPSGMRRTILPPKRSLPIMHRAKKTLNPRGRLTMVKIPQKTFQEPSTSGKNDLTLDAKNTCTMCGFVVRYTHRNNAIGLKRKHAKMHLPRKPHKCSECGKEFRRPDHANSHVRRQHQYLVGSLATSAIVWAVDKDDYLMQLARKTMECFPLHEKNVSTIKDKSSVEPNAEEPHYVKQNKRKRKKPWKLVDQEPDGMTNDK